MVLLRILLLLIPVSLFAQTGFTPYPAKSWFKDTVLMTKQLKINSTGGAIIGGYNKNADAILELSSTTKTFLPPRMTAVQRLAISPTAGAIVYDTDSSKVCYYNSSWVCLSNTGGGGGGTNIYNSDGTLTADRIVTLGNKILTFQDSVNIQNIIRINDADLAFQVGSITDSFQSTVNIFNTTQENGIASSSTGIEIGHYMDSTSSIDKLSYNGLVFQQGVFDNLGTKENITTEMNIFSPSLGRDIGYLGMHFGHWEYFISDTLSGASEFPQGHGVYAMDSVITATHVTARSGGGEYLTKYATKFKADTAFSFLLDSSNTPVLSVHRNGIKIVDGTQGNGKVLTSNASGLASWQANTNYILNGADYSVLTNLNDTIRNSTSFTHKDTTGGGITSLIGSNGTFFSNTADGIVFQSFLNTVWTNPTTGNYCLVSQFENQHDVFYVGNLLDGNKTLFSLRDSTGEFIFSGDRLLVEDTSNNTVFDVQTISAVTSIHGTLHYQDGNEDDGYVLKSDINGTANWSKNSGLPVVYDSLSALTGVTVNLDINTVQIIASSASVTSMTINFPAGATNDEITVIFEKGVVGLSISGTGTSTLSLPSSSQSSSRIFKNYGGNWY